MKIQEIISKNPKGLIARAFKFAERAHQGQTRENGEPYFSHSLATAEFLSQWHLDDVTIAAGLLHDVPVLTSISIDEIKKEFGNEVTAIVQGVAKLNLIPYRTTTNKIDNLRKMILALSGDLRIIFVKLANRLHNMKTVNFLHAKKQKEVVKETDDIYAPIATLIGMQNLGGELHDLCFPYLYPQEHEWVIKNVKDRYEERESYISEFKPLLEKTLVSHNLKPVFIDSRTKRYSSLYSKLRRYNMDIEKIHDLVAIWIVMPAVDECYEALGVIHKYWPPLPGRIKDYIAIPKTSGYRSLHTTIVGPKEKHIEVQIHTSQMYEENKNGLAAHWLYKQNLAKKPVTPKSLLKGALRQIPLIKHLRRWQEESIDPQKRYEEFLGAMKIDFFKDRIFAITPKGDVIDLPRESTPVDFAYKIHTEIGNACSRAVVNNKIKPLNTKLNSGDVVIILTQKGKKPSQDWLKFIKTPEARYAIKNFTKRSY